MVLENLKIRVKNPEESKIAQEWAFKQGYKWDNGPKLQQFDKKYLVFYTHFVILGFKYVSSFRNSLGKEIFISDIINQNSNEEIWF